MRLSAARSEAAPARLADTRMPYKRARTAAGITVPRANRSFTVTPTPKHVESASNGRHRRAAAIGRGGRRGGRAGQAARGADRPAHDQRLLRPRPGAAAPYLKRGISALLRPARRDTVRRHGRLLAPSADPRLPGRPTTGAPSAHDLRLRRLRRRAARPRLGWQLPGRAAGRGAARYRVEHLPPAERHVPALLLPVETWRGTGRPRARQRFRLPAGAAGGHAARAGARLVERGHAAGRASARRYARGLCIPARAAVTGRGRPL